MNVLSAMLIVGHGADTAVLKTDLPPSVYPYTDNVAVSFDIAKGKGEAYLRKNFRDIPIEVVHIPQNRPSFSEH